MKDWVRRMENRRDRKDQMSPLVWLERREKNWALFDINRGNINNVKQHMLGRCVLLLTHRAVNLQHRHGPMLQSAHFWADEELKL